MEKYFLLYFGFINLLSAVICAADKIKAVNGSYRISEKTLWLLSLLGGSVCMYLTMRAIRHKTLHKSFMIGLPLLIIAQIATVWLLTKLYYGHIMF